MSLWWLFPVTFLSFVSLEMVSRRIFSPHLARDRLCLATSYFLEVGLTRPFKDSWEWPCSDICQLSALEGAAHQALWIYRLPSCFKCSLSGSSSTEGKSSLLWAFSLKGFPAFSHCLLLFSPIFLIRILQREITLYSDYIQNKSAYGFQVLPCLDAHYPFHLKLKELKPFYLYQPAVPNKRTTLSSAQNGRKSSGGSLFLLHMPAIRSPSQGVKGGSCRFHAFLRVSLFSRP